MLHRIGELGETRTRGLVASLLVLLVLAGLLLAPSPATAEHEPSSSEPELEMKLSVLLSGSVHDERGRPMVDVSMVVTELRLSDSITRGLGSPLAERRYRELISGWFEVSCEGCIALELRFEKPGYLAATVTSEGDDESEITREHSDSSLEIHLQRHGLNIVLRSAENVVWPARAWGRLVAGEQGPEQVMALSGDRWRSCNLTGIAEPGCELRLQVQMEPGEQGLARLEVGDSKGGLILVPGGPRQDSSFMEGMRLAPADGYSTSVELEPAGSGEYYFYLRLGERFGKGSITPPRLGKGSRPGQAVIASVILYLNPTGGRELCFDRCHDEPTEQ